MTLAKQVEQFFEANGPLATRLSGYHPRPVQLQMANAVAETIEEESGRLICEAGTGTGKSLAYLVPLLLSDQKAMVSTGTRALQDQLFFHDLPLLLSAVKEVTGKEKTALLMKGRANYLCLYRLDNWAPTGDLLNPKYNKQLDIIRDWSETTTTGDFAEVSGLSDDSPIVSELSAKADICLGQSCPLYVDCHVTRLRRKALGADVLVINHALLCADRTLRIRSSSEQDQEGDSAFSQVVPDTDVWVIDEAHALEDAATRHFGVSVTAKQLRLLTRDLLAQEWLILETERPNYIGAASELANLFARLIERLSGGLQPRKRVMREAFGEDVLSLISEMQEQFRALRVSLLALRPCAGEEKAMMGALLRRVEKLQGEITFLLAGGAQEAGYICYLEQDLRGAVLQASPVDVAQVLDKSLWRTKNPVVLTSATLAVGNDVAPFARRIGIADPNINKLVLESPFDFENQAALYVPGAAKEPTHPEYAPWFFDEARFLVNLSQGGSFLLFTSYRFLEIAFSALKNEFESAGYTVLKQGDAPKIELIKAFKEAKGHRAVLFATHSFWEGVDVRGQALRMVIIDRLPFRAPDDPVYEARSEQLKQKGLSPFMHLALPEAALTLKQGVGRLIRSNDDFGVVGILDGRLRTANYGRLLLNALPPMKRLTERQGVEAFWSNRSAV